jgi:hypothetical protein
MITFPKKLYVIPEDDSEGEEAGGVAKYVLRNGG